MKNQRYRELEWGGRGDRNEALKIGGTLSMVTPLTQNRGDSIHANGEESSFFGTGVSEITDEAQARLKDAGDMLKTVIINRPTLALGAALAAGVFLGWLIKRR